MRRVRESYKYVIADLTGEDAVRLAVPFEQPTIEL